MLSTHEAWTYTTPGSQGYANPQPEWIRADQWESVRTLLTSRRQNTTVLKHLRLLAEAFSASGLGAKDDTAREVFQTLSRNLNNDKRQWLSDLFTIGLATSCVGLD